MPALGSQSVEEIGRASVAPNEPSLLPRKVPLLAGPTASPSRVQTGTRSACSGPSGRRPPHGECASVHSLLRGGRQAREDKREATESDASKTLQVPSSLRDLGRCGETKPPGSARILDFINLSRGLAWDYPGIPFAAGFLSGVLGFFGPASKTHRPPRGGMDLELNGRERSSEAAVAAPARVSPAYWRAVTGGSAPFTVGAARPGVGSAVDRGPGARSNSSHRSKGLRVTGRSD